MITQIMQAMVDQAPAKAVKLQREGRFERYATAVAKRAAERLAAQNPPSHNEDPNRRRMMREVELAHAIEEAIAPEDVSTLEETT